MKEKDKSTKYGLKFRRESFIENLHECRGHKLVIYPPTYYELALIQIPKKIHSREKGIYVWKRQRI